MIVDVTAATQHSIENEVVKNSTTEWTVAVSEGGEGMVAVSGGGE